MTARRKSDRMAWFKLDAGAFMADTSGLSLAHAGAYARLLSLYWMGGNALPDTEGRIMRKVGATTEEDAQVVREALEEFFPDGKHPALDDALQTIHEEGIRKRAAARQRWGSQPRQPSQPTGGQPGSADEDF